MRTKDIKIYEQGAVPMHKEKADVKKTAKSQALFLCVHVCVRVHVFVCPCPWISPEDEKNSHKNKHLRV